MATLHELTGNTRFLRDSVRGDSLRFYRYGSNADQQGCGNIACNYNGNRHIFIGNGTFSSNSWAVQKVLHEIGHNWDDASENAYVSAFRSVSGWIKLPSNISTTVHVQAKGGWQRFSNAEFARQYGGNTNPWEDFATSFAAYVMTESDVPGYNFATDVGTTNGFRNWMNGTGPMPTKVQIMDQWIGSIS